MSLSNNDNIAEEIKSRCNIVDVIGRVVVLKKTGANHKGLCPFHNEKTPSFVVSEDKQIYTCFGCGASGDLIHFVEQYHNLDFKGAVEKIAEEYGITIKDSFQKDSKREKYYEINKEAATFFYKNFWNTDNPAYRYMMNRGISPETMKKFGLGYAEPQWDGLIQYFENKGIDKKLLLELGLVSHSKGKYFDKYRNRVMFPIINTRGKIVGFGGRAIGDDIPKYLNSSESSIFMKKDNLYGLSLTRPEIDREGVGILVEGYMDVISLYQHGVRNCCASLGTALTENQARLLKRYVNQAVLAYDGDEAGQNAALRGMDILYREGLQVRVLQVGGAKDPDEFIKKEGREAFIKLTQDALPFAEYKFQRLKSKHDLQDTEGRIGFLKEAALVLRQLSPVEGDAYINKLSLETGVAASAIRLEAFNAPSAMEPKPKREVSQGRKKEPIPEMDMAEKSIIKLILRNGEFMDRFRESGMELLSPAGRHLMEAIENIYIPGEDIPINKMEEWLDDNFWALLSDIQENTPVAGPDQSFFDDCIRSLQQRQWVSMEKDLISRLSLADEEENYDKIKEITQELMGLQKLNNRDRR